MYPDGAGQFCIEASCIEEKFCFVDIKISLLALCFNILKSGLGFERVFFGAIA